MPRTARRPAMTDPGELLLFVTEGQPEYARGSYTSREAAEDAARSQQQIVGPRGQTCEAWVVDRRQASR
jgi:hypothetical protein